MVDQTKQTSQSNFNETLLICTDLDRTLLPNGHQLESADARQSFGKLVALPQIKLAYVSGRHQSLVIDAINQYELPKPDFVIADVGTTIYNVENDQWNLWPQWHNDIKKDWQNHEYSTLHNLLSDRSELRLQEIEKQGVLKLSYYVDLNVNKDRLIASIYQRLQEHSIEASVIWSIDEPENVGLLDILPASATKYHAIECLMKHHGFCEDTVLFAGDSGNDLPVLVSPLNSILVANASEEIKLEAAKEASRNKTEKQLYIAQGGYLGMNGNYSAGIIEGVVHFKPQFHTIWQ